MASKEITSTYKAVNSNFQLSAPIILDTPKTNFDVLKKFVINLGGVVVPASFVEDDKQNNKSKTKSAKEKTSNNETSLVVQKKVSSCQNNEVCAECSDLGLLEPYYQSNFQSLPTFKDLASLKFIKSEELAKVDLQADQTKSMIEELRREITSIYKKQEISKEDESKLKRKTEKLNKDINELETLAKNVQKTAFMHHACDREVLKKNDIENSEEVPNEKLKDQPDLQQNFSGSGGEDHVTDLVPVESAEMLPIDSHRAKIKEELQMISAELETDLADCFSNLDCSTNRSSNIEGFKSTAQDCTIESSCTYIGDYTPSNEVTENSVVSLTIPNLNSNSNLFPSMTNRLSDSYEMQDRLAREIKTYEDIKYQLEVELLEKESETERLQGLLQTYQSDLRNLQRENMTLMEKLNASKNQESLKQNQTAKETKDSIDWLEDEIRRLKTDVSLLHTEREELTVKKMNAKNSLQGNQHFDRIPLNDIEGQLADSQNRCQSLQRDFESAHEKIRSLEFKNINLNGHLSRALEENKNLVERERQLKRNRGEIAHMEDVTNQKELQIIELTQQKKLAQEEIDELRSLLEDQGLEIQDYRKKYLQAQQRAEELNGELDQQRAEVESVRNESILELRTMKAQYHEKVVELENMSAMRKEMQIKLQENQQHRLLVEQALEEAKREITHVKDTNNMLKQDLDKERSGKTLIKGEREKLESLIAEGGVKQNKLITENTDLQTQLARLEEANTHLEQRIMEKSREVTEITKTLEATREDAVRQLNRSKERNDSARRTMQVHISDLERELAVARANVKNTQKERDEVRQKLQMQIKSLTETLEEGQTRWKGLQAHVTSLQNSLHPNTIVPRRSISSIITNEYENKNKATMN